MDTAHAWLMTDALRDVVRHGTAVGSVGSRINFPAGGKTGTTNDGFDVWFIGFTPDLVTGVWIGFDQPKKIKGNAQGGVLAAPAWTAMMREVYERRAIPAAWPRPDGLTALDIDKTTGYKATPFCPKDVHYIESFIPGHRADGLLSDTFAVRRGGNRRDGDRHRSAHRPGSCPTEAGAGPGRRRAPPSPPAVPESWAAPGPPPPTLAIACRPAGSRPAGCFRSRARPSNTPRCWSATMAESWRRGPEIGAESGGRRDRVVRRRHRRSRPDQHTYSSGAHRPCGGSARR